MLGQAENKAHLQEERYAVQICGHGFQADALQLGPLIASIAISSTSPMQQHDMSQPLQAEQTAHPLMDLPAAERLTHIEARVCWHLISCKAADVHASYKEQAIILELQV